MKKIFLLMGGLLGAFCTSHAQSPAAKPLQLGITETFHSGILGEDRSLNIYLPEGYHQNDTTRYPIIYLLDGGVEEDFIHVAGLVQFCSFEWVGYLKPSIVVGIVNTDRKRDFTFPSAVAQEQKAYPVSGKSGLFRKALKTEIFPFVARHYRVSQDDRTLIGESLGGLLATEILLKSPFLFRKYILISPSLWWSNGALLQDSLQMLSRQLRDSTQVFIASGKEGLAPSATPHVMEVDANLLADKLQSLNNPLLRMYFDYLPAENHATIAQQALLNAFRRLAGR